MNDKKDRLDFPISLNNVTYFISCYRSNICSDEVFKQVPHQHFDVEFHYIYGGEEVICNNSSNKSVTLTEGQIAFIPKKIYHSAYSVNSVDRICFCLNAEYNEANNAPTASDYYRVHAIFEYFKEIQIISDTQIVSLMTAYRNICTQSKHFINHQKGLLLTSVIMRLLELLNAGVPSKFKNDERNYAISSMNRKWIIEEHICRNYDKSDGIEELAKLLCLSERQTRSFIQKEFNSNYKKLIVRQRMEIANIMMQSSDKSLDEIAMLVGYRSYSGFYLAYSNFFGISPEKARENTIKEQGTKEE